MILPMPQDVESIKTTRNSVPAIEKYKRILESICHYRREKAPSLIIEENSGSFFNWETWEIVIDSPCSLNFLHELGHLISLIDRGRFGSENEAESFAHGCNMFLFPCKYDNINRRWYHMPSETLKSVMWTKEYLLRLDKIITEQNDGV